MTATATATTTVKATKTRVFDGISGKYRDVLISENRMCFTTLDNQELYRIETKGRTGKVLYRNGFYVSVHTGKEIQVHGMDGATGRGWGGCIIGYATEEEIENYPVVIR